MATYEDVTAFEPDELVWAVADAAAGCRSARAEERAEARWAQREFVSVQSGFAGGVRVYGELGPVAGAGLVNALDAAADAPAGTGGPADAPADADAAEAGVSGEGGAAAADPPGVWSSRPRSRQYAAALGRICADWLGGGDRDHPRPARPLLVSHVDVSTMAADHAGGTIEMGVRGGLARITAATAEALAASGDVRAVVFDGARPLAATGKVNAGDIPAATRFAVAARDRGCRFPGSRDPAAHTDVHHLRERHDGGGHHPDNLALISRRYHTMPPRRGWTLTLQPDTGTITARRGARTIHSLPKGTQLAHPASPSPNHQAVRPRAGPTRHANPADADGSAQPADRADPHPGQLPF